MDLADQLSPDLSEAHRWIRDVFNAARRIRFVVTDLWKRSDELTENLAEDVSSCGNLLYRLTQGEMAGRKAYDRVTVQLLAQVSDGECPHSEALAYAGAVLMTLRFAMPSHGGFENPFTAESIAKQRRLIEESMRNEVKPWDDTILRRMEIQAAKAQIACGKNGDKLGSRPAEATEQGEVDQSGRGEMAVKSATISWQLSPDEKGTSILELRALRDDFLILHRDYPLAQIDWLVLNGDQLTWGFKTGTKLSPNETLCAFPPSFDRMRYTIQRAGRVLQMEWSDNEKRSAPKPIDDPIDRWVWFLIVYRRHLSSVNEASGVHVHPEGHQTGTFYAAMEASAAAIDWLLSSVVDLSKDERRRGPPTQTQAAIIAAHELLKVVKDLPTNAVSKPPKWPTRELLNMAQAKAEALFLNLDALHEPGCQPWGWYLEDAVRAVFFECYGIRFHLATNTKTRRRHVLVDPRDDVCNSSQENRRRYLWMMAGRDIPPAKAELVDELAVAVERFAIEFASTNDPSGARHQNGAALAGEQPSTLVKSGKPDRISGHAPGDAEMKIISALTKWHEYADGGCLKTDPIVFSELARMASRDGGPSVGKSTVSEFFQRKFGDGKTGGLGRRNYLMACKDAATLAGVLKVLNDEITPYMILERIRRESNED